jgi:branched-chain amino acid transport system substrate-binding protein
MSLTRRGFGLAAAGILATPQIARAADPIVIGAVVPLTGPAAESGRYAQNGIAMALEDVNQTPPLGRPLKIVFEDDQTTNPGAVLEFSRLAGRADVVAFIGPIRSTQVHAMAPDVLKIGKPMMFGGTDPGLTHAGNPWLFRCRPNDSYSARVIAQYGVQDLGKRKWAVVYSTDAFGTAGAKALEQNLNSRGITPLLMQGYPNQTVDFTAVVLAVRQSGADVLSSYMTFEGDEGIFARQLRQLGVHIPWVGSASTVAVPTMKLAGPALYGTFGVADFAVDANDTSRAFGQRYSAAYNAPPDDFAAWPFDAIHILARAFGDAAGTDPAKVRSAILAIRGYQGAEGEYDYDQNGDGLHGYNIVRNDNGKLVYVRRFDFAAS